MAQGEAQDWFGQAKCSQENLRDGYFDQRAAKVGAKVEAELNKFGLSQNAHWGPQQRGFSIKLTRKVKQRWKKRIK